MPHHPVLFIVFILLISSSFAALTFESASPSPLNDRPIIGVLTQPFKGDAKKHYIVASYVKYLESAGARVVPIFYDEERAKLVTLVSKLNGLLFTGGGMVC